MVAAWLLLSPAAVRLVPSRGRPAAMSEGASAWASAIVKTPPLASWKQPLEQAIEQLDWGERAAPELVLLAMPQEHAASLQEASSELARSLGPSMLLAVVAAGAIGGGEEIDTEPSLSITAGSFPVNTTLTPFVLTSDRMPVWSQIAPGEGARPAFLLFADPYSAVTQAVAALDNAYPAAVVAGGLSCPSSQASPSLAFYSRGAQCRALPVGSVLGLSIRGPNTEVHTACAQGAAAVGPAFEVTSAKDNLVITLDGKPAVQCLAEVAKSVGEDERTINLLRRALLVGVATPAEVAEGEEESSQPNTGDDGMVDDPDFLIRQVLGSDPSGGIYIGEVARVGMKLQFHVRDELAARQDLAAVLGRYMLQRQFSGRFSRDGVPVQPLASFQFSCNGRGNNMYSDKSVDLGTFSKSVSDVPTGGFFCNGEIAPVGISGLDASPTASVTTTHLHGFTSVWAIVYDTSPTE